MFLVGVPFGVLDYADQRLRQLPIATPPKQGEDFHVIADDFQNFIVPGKNYCPH